MKKKLLQLMNDAEFDFKKCWGLPELLEETTDKYLGRNGKIKDLQKEFAGVSAKVKTETAELFNEVLIQIKSFKNKANRINHSCGLKPTEETKATKEEK